MKIYIEPRVDMCEVTLKTAICSGGSNLPTEQPKTDNNPNFVIGRKLYI